MLKNDNGITLVSLVVTIIVLVIVSGIIAYSLSDIDKTTELTNEVKDQFSDEKKEAEHEINKINGEWGDVISKKQIDGETVPKTRLTASEVSAINTHTSLQTINYTPDTVGTTVTIPANYNGGATAQTFNQSNLGTQSLKWYVLSADENGVNLVSQPTSKTVQFKDAGGYDNCLYYLNELSTKLFTKESLGVTADRVHALNLSDIKKAAEGMNGSSYNWDTKMIQASNTNAYNNGSVGTKTFTPSNKKYPQIYGTSEGAVNTNNPMYDEEIPANYNPISGDLINSTSKTASTLTVNYTYLNSSSNSTTKTRLNTFGNSGIGGELFNSSGTNYWLASRCVNSDSNYAYFGLRRVYSGYLNYYSLCYSSGSAYSSSYAFRCVVSIPASMVNVSSNGTVTLK